jgi:alpha-amylase
MRSEHHEAGDFILGTYNAICKQSKGNATVIMERNGNVAGHNVRLKKVLSFRSGAAELNAAYTIENLGNEALDTSFGSEFNFSLLAGNAQDRYYDIPGHTLEKRNLASFGETIGVKQVCLVDEWLRLTVSLEFSQPAVLWRAPVETVSQSEAGFERVFQSSMVMPIWRLSLLPGRSWETQIRVVIQ